MKFTKEQRHQIYLKAKEMFKEGYCVGMCMPINDASRDLYNYDLCLDEDDNNENDMDIDLLPEFKAIRPEGVTCNSFWWNNDDRQTRLDNFDKLIEQTK